MAYAYQTLPDGTVQTLAADGTWTTPWPSPAEIKLYDDMVDQWTPLVEDAAARYSLPDTLVPGILGIIYSESGGKAHIGPSFDGGVGLMAITAEVLKRKPGGGHYTSDELKDPALNIDIGVGKMIAPEFAVMGLDLPQIASGFNAGFGKAGAHRSTEGPWGWREYKIPSTGAHPYISKVVRINNYVVERRRSGLGPSGGGATPEGAGMPSEPSSSPSLLSWLAILAVAGVAYAGVRRWIEVTR